ncbi:MAG TPA: hypothetical protein VFM18_02585 [Methanosarcina sp.]|nr:hypothetical protein [Methanosarcina sp.]
MEKRYFSNNATTTVTTDSGTTLVVASTANFPSSYPFYVTLENGSLVREIVKVTSLASTNTWNVIRAQEGTVHTTFTSGNKCELRLTAGTLNSLVTDKAELSGDTFTGQVNVKYASGNGSIEFTGGNTTNTGYIAFRAPDGTTRTGYIGYSDSGNQYIVTENGRQLSFNINNSPNAIQFQGASGSVSKIFIDGRDVPRRFPSGSTLPTSDIGPIWHDDYNDWMIWQVFNANGASYSGYASVNIGRVLADSTNNTRTGTVRSGVSVSKTTYAALWNWAIHNNMIIALTSWTTGQLQYADNGNGTFRVPDIRGMFSRFYHDGSSYFDPDYATRAFTDRQMDSIASHSHALTITTDAGTFASRVPFGGSNVWGAVFTQSAGESETRPKNFNQLATIKF